MRFMVWLRRLVIIIVATAFSAGAGDGAEENCFGPSSLSGSGLSVLQLAPPPRPNDEHYTNWPATDVATQQVPLLLRPRDKRVRIWWTQWANRCMALGQSNSPCRERAKGNYLAPRLFGNGKEIRPYFSSFDKANGCTLIQAKYALGSSLDSLTAEAIRIGLSIELDRQSLPRRAVNGRLVDICVAPEARLPPEVEGSVLDYEVADARTESQTYDFLREYAALFHHAGKKVILYPNALNAPSQRYTNITSANASHIYHMFDKTSLFLWTGTKAASLAASLQEQLQILRGPSGRLPIDPTRLMVLYELKSSSIQDTANVRQLMIKVGIKDVVFWRNRVYPGGDCNTDVNRRIECLIHGHCNS